MLSASPKFPAPPPWPSTPDPPPVPRTKDTPPRTGTPRSTPSSSSTAIHAHGTAAPKIQSRPDTRQTNTNSARKTPSHSLPPPLPIASASSPPHHSPVPLAALQL